MIQQLEFLTKVSTVGTNVSPFDNPISNFSAKDIRIRDVSHIFCFALRCSRRDVSVAGMSFTKLI